MDVETNISIYRISRTFYDEVTHKSVKKCLSVNPGLNDQVEEFDCPTSYEDPYFLFRVLIKDARTTILSTFAGKCIGVGKDGKLVYNTGCDVNTTTLMKKDDNLFTQSGRCASEKGGCNDYVFEDVGSNHRIWWDVDAIFKASGLKEKRREIIQKEFEKNNKINFSSLPSLKFTTDKGWSFDASQQEIKNYTSYIWNKFSVIGKENKTVAWPGYRSRNPVCIIVFGSSGVGKTNVVNYYAAKYGKNPVLISYDIPVEKLNEFKALSHLETIGFPDLASDPTAYKTFYRFASQVEESIKNDVIAKKLDIIIEKADIPKISDILALKSSSYDVNLVYVYGKSRKNRAVSRFTQTGRLGSYFEEIKEESVVLLGQQLLKEGISIETINVG